ncbi:MAG: transglutaminase domain-containing protein [Deltaproteobacteria bacterium]|nr:transglutaminase domain-containing protein [Deltaproteobacteria bacterium]
MRLGLAHELGLAASCTASLLIVLLGGELPAFAWVTLAAPWLSLALQLAGKQPPASSGTLVGLASVALAVATLVNGGVESSVLAFAELLLGLLCARLLVRRTATHDVQALLVALLLVLAGSVLNVTLSYLWLFITFAVTLVWSLATRQLLAAAPRDLAQEHTTRRQRTDVVTPAFFGATAALSLSVLTVAALVFALFPRVGFGEIGAFLRKESTLPSEVGLRGDPRALGGSRAVARVRGVPYQVFERGLYLRATVYDVVTLDGFSRTPSTTEIARRPRSATLVDAARARYEVTLAPMVGDTLVSLGQVDALRIVSGGMANPNFSLGFAGRTSRDELKANDTLVSSLRYEVGGGIAAPGEIGAPRASARALDPSDADDARWLTLPADMGDELRQLAAQAAGGTTDVRTMAEAVRAFLLAQFRYSLDPPRFARAPLRAFLLEDRQGHCEFFAAAHALLLRANGIGARVVGGFQGGAWDEGTIVFQERHAHAWVEWYLPGHGWVVDDGTPLASAPREQLTGLAAVIEALRRQWDDRVLDYSIGDQSDAFQRLRRAVRGLDVRLRRVLAASGAAMVLVLVVVVWVRWRRRARRAPEHPLARALLEVAAQRMRRPVTTATTVREAVAAARAGLAAADPLTHALDDALTLYEGIRFGGDPPDARTIRAARARLSAAAARARARERRAPLGS